MVNLIADIQPQDLDFEEIGFDDGSVFQEFMAGRDTLGLPALDVRPKDEAYLLYWAWIYCSVIGTWVKFTRGELMKFLIDFTATRRGHRLHTYRTPGVLGQETPIYDMSFMEFRCFRSLCERGYWNMYINPEKTPLFEYAEKGRKLVWLFHMPL